MLHAHIQYSSSQGNMSCHVMQACPHLRSAAFTIRRRRTRRQNLEHCTAPHRIRTLPSLLPAASQPAKPPLLSLIISPVFLHIVILNLVAQPQRNSLS